MRYTTLPVPEQPHLTIETMVGARVAGFIVTVQQPKSPREALLTLRDFWGILCVVRRLHDEEHFPVVMPEDYYMEVLRGIDMIQNSMFELEDRLERDGIRFSYY